jgi:hypothetical protein
MKRSKRKIWMKRSNSHRETKRMMVTEVKKTKRRRRKKKRSTMRNMAGGNQKGIIKFKISRMMKTKIRKKTTRKKSMSIQILALDEHVSEREMVL